MLALIQRGEACLLLVVFAAVCWLGAHGAGLPAELPQQDVVSADLEVVSCASLS